MTESEYRRGYGKVIRALFASLATALNAVGSGGLMPMARPDEHLPDKPPEYRP